MQYLAGSAVTEFRIHWLSAHLVSDPAAKARGPVPWNKCRIIKGRICGSESVRRCKHHNVFQDLQQASDAMVRVILAMTIA